MAKLILSMDGLVLKEIPLVKERMSIGRRPSNDIQIDNLAISGEHAAVVTILNDSFLEDLNSTNGTLVNGQPVKKHFLKNNDVIEMGKYKLKYISEHAAPSEPSDYEKTMVLRANSEQRAPDGGEPEPGPQGVQRRQGDGADRVGVRADAEPVPEPGREEARQRQARQARRRDPALDEERHHLQRRQRQVDHQAQHQLLEQVGGE